MFESCKFKNKNNMAGSSYMFCEGMPIYFIIKRNKSPTCLNGHLSTINSTLLNFYYGKSSYLHINRLILHVN